MENDSNICTVHSDDLEMTRNRWSEVALDEKQFRRLSAIIAKLVGERNGFRDKIMRLIYAKGIVWEEGGQKKL